MAGLTGEAKIYFYNYPENQLVYMREQNASVASDDDIASTQFDSESTLG